MSSTHYGTRKQRVLVLLDRRTNLNPELTITWPQLLSQEFTFNCFPLQSNLGRHHCTKVIERPNSPSVCRSLDVSGSEGLSIQGLYPGRHSILSYTAWLLHVKPSFMPRNDNSVATDKCDPEHQRVDRSGGALSLMCQSGPPTEVSRSAKRD